MKRLRLRLFPITLLLLANGILCAQVLPIVQQAAIRKHSFNIVSLGTLADGATLNTKSINDAITACSKKGGGVALVPAGLWLAGPLVLQCTTNLYMVANAIPQFTTDFHPYKVQSKDIHVMARNTNPVVGVFQNQDIGYNNFCCTKDAAALRLIGGEGLTKITATKTAPGQAKENLPAALGADGNEVKF